MIGFLILTRFAIALVLFTFVKGNEGYREDYSNYTVIRITSLDEQQIKSLSLLQNELKLDLWNEPRAPSVPILTHASPPMASRFLEALRSHGLEYEIVSRNLQRMIDSQRRTSARSSTCDNPNYEMYHTYENLMCIYKKMAEKYSNRVKMEKAGTTIKGENMYKVTVSADGRDKPEVMFECGIHAREWITPATCLWMVKEMVQKSPNWLNKFNVVLIPVMNPDGYKVTHTTDRMRRKNLRNTFCWKLGGVDLNRNCNAHFYDFGGASILPCAPDYRGLIPFSEPETKALKKVVSSLKDPIAYFSVHAFSQLWLYPYGYTGVPAPNQKELDKLARIATDVLYKVHGMRYKPGQIKTTIYKTTGTTVDWAYSKANISRAFAIELRDQGGYGFLLPKDQIKPTGEEFTAAINAVMEEIARIFK